MRTMTLLLTTMLTLAAVTVEAQPLTVTQYRLTRWTDTGGTLTNPQTFTVAKTALGCNLTPLPAPSSRGFRFDDQDNVGRDCQYLGDAGGILNTTVTTWAWTIAAGTVDGIWSGEVRGTVRTVPAPSNPRVLPGVGVDAGGTVVMRFPFQNGPDLIDVATIQVDGGPILQLGAWSLTLPGYSVAVGDRVWVSLTKPAR